MAGSPPIAIEPPRYTASLPLEIFLARAAARRVGRRARMHGNRLTFGGPNPTEFLIEGNQMKGSSQGAPRGNPWDITLMKTK